MKIIIGGRGTGKTAALIQQSAEEGYCIVCHSRQEASRIQSQAIQMGLSISTPITYGELLRRDYYPPGVVGLLIDNVDKLLEYLFAMPVHTITITREEDNG